MVFATVLSKEGQIRDRKFSSAGLCPIAKPDAVASQAHYTSKLMLAIWHSSRQFPPARRRCFAAMARHPLLLRLTLHRGAPREAKQTGGEGGIRTPDRLAPMPHFECGAIDHSATSPGATADGTCVLWSRRLLGEDGRPDKARESEKFGRAVPRTQRPGGAAEPGP
jgi:hypothetical protein